MFSQDDGFGSTFGLSNQWSVWGVRPPPGGAADIVFFALPLSDSIG